MSTITLHGFPRSTYVRSAMMTCAEKAVAFDLKPFEFRGADHLAVHPFAKMPAMTHGAFVLFETGAIMRYIDDVFPGPSLQPEDRQQRAPMDQWLSAISDYLFDDMVRGWPAEDAPDDEVEAAVALRSQPLAVVESAYGDHDYLVGESLSLADLLLAPIVDYVGALAHGPRLLAETPSVRRAAATMRARPSFAAAKAA